MALKFLAVAAMAAAFLCSGVERSQAAVDAINSKVTCEKFVSPLGSNDGSGTATEPYLTVDKLANSLRAGDTGCLRAGVYDEDVEITRGGTAEAPTTITSFPGERATVVGRLHVTNEANHVLIQQLELDGRNDAGLPSPTVNGDHVVFRDNDVTNHHTSICFLLGSDEWGRAEGTVIERNRIHNCGELPPTNHHHGIYVEESEGARITDNWIYDNADRGIQLFPDAHGTYIAGNVLDGNGQGVVFSRRSSNNVLERNVLSYPLIRYNLEDYELTGSGNIARRNCLWSVRHWGNAGVQLDFAVPAWENVVTEPGYVGRERKDFRLTPGSQCAGFNPGPGSGALELPRARKKPRRPVLLRASAGTVRIGRRLRLRATLQPGSPPAPPDARAMLRVRHGGAWRRVGAMRPHGRGYSARVRLVERRRPRALRRLGRATFTRGRRTLRLRAFVAGVGSSNLVIARVRR